LYADEQNARVALPFDPLAATCGKFSSYGLLHRLEHRAVVFVAVGLNIQIRWDAVQAFVTNILDEPLHKPVIFPP
jgi:hypothetical protein